MYYQLPSGTPPEDRLKLTAASPAAPRRLFCFHDYATTVLGQISYRQRDAVGRPGVTVAVSADLVGRFSAVDLARAAVSAMGGQGAGGKPDFAQGGAPDAAKAEDGLKAIRAGWGVKLQTRKTTDARAFRGAKPVKAWASAPCPGAGR